MAQSWLDDFLEYASGGESPRKYLFWVGVSVVAGVLRRKVWIDQVDFQWTPNFYVLLVGPPGVKKTTSMNIGYRLLKKIEGINFGPQSITWQQLVTHMAESRQTFGPDGAVFRVDGEPFEASCVSIKISEFGTFFDPLNRELVDNLTDMWDSAIDTMRKETRTMGSDEVVNPWLNIVAGTTPTWIKENFTANLVGSGFASRPVYVYADKPERNIAYPSLQIQNTSEKISRRTSLVERLRNYAELAGEFQMSDDAYGWGMQWYEKFRAAQAQMSPQDAGFVERRQAHLHKLAMVLCVARDGFPTITEEDMILADAKLTEIEADAHKVFSQVGSTRMSTAAGNIVDTLRRVGPTKRSDLFRRYFFRMMSSEEFEIAMKSVQSAGLVKFGGSSADWVISLKE
jgi:energy-coupling factor transporter ATP-binding protein EcfA2